MQPRPHFQLIAKLNCSHHCFSECTSEDRVVEVSISLISDVVTQNKERDHFSANRKWFYSFLYPSCPVLVYCSHSFQFPLPIHCVLRPVNAMIYRDVQPANHNTSSPFSTASFLSLVLLLASVLYRLISPFFSSSLLLFILSFFHSLFSFFQIFHPLNFPTSQQQLY